MEGMGEGLVVTMNHGSIRMLLHKSLENGLEKYFVKQVLFTYAFTRKRCTRQDILDVLGKARKLVSIIMDKIH